jgi:hypothetical protein
LPTTGVRVRSLVLVMSTDACMSHPVMRKQLLGRRRRLRQAMRLRRSSSRD